MKYNHYVSTLLLFKKPFIETHQYLVCCCSAFPKNMPASVTTVDCCHCQILIVPR